MKYLYPLFCKNIRHYKEENKNQHQFYHQEIIIGNFQRFILCKYILYKHLNKIRSHYILFGFFFHLTFSNYHFSYLLMAALYFFVSIYHKSFSQPLSLNILVISSRDHQFANIFVLHTHYFL